MVTFTTIVFRQAFRTISFQLLTCDLDMMGLSTPVGGHIHGLGGAFNTLLDVTMAVAVDTVKHKVLTVRVSLTSCLVERRMYLASPRLSAYL